MQKKIIERITGSEFTRKPLRTLKYKVKEPSISRNYIGFNYPNLLKT